MKKLFLTSLFLIATTSQAAELKGGSQYEYTIRTAGCPIIGFAWGRA